MTTKQIESAVQDRTVENYRNAWGYPLGLNQRASSWALFAWATVGIVAASALLWMLA